jgi:hypothetical protein
LRDRVKFLVKVNVEGRQRFAGLVRALDLYLHGQSDARFGKKVDELQIRTLRRFVDFLSLKRRETTHGDPDTAFPFALMILAFTLDEIMVRNKWSKNWVPLLPKDDEHLGQELSRNLLAYLGVKKIE